MPDTTRLPGSISRAWALLAALGLAACAPKPEIVPCEADCELEVFLPENPAMPPRVPPVIRVVGDQTITIAVWGRRPGQARSVLVFDQPAIEDEQGRPQFTVELLPGQNPLHLRRFEDGICHAPEGCGYFVVNAGLAARPPASPPAGILIIDPQARPE